MWRILTWCHQNNVTLRVRHVPGSLNVTADGHSRRNQIQSTEWSLSPQIFKQISKIWESPQVDLNNQPEQETSSLCLSDSRSSGLGSRCPQHSMGKHGCLRISSHRPAAQGCTKTSISNVQDNSDCPRLADKTMVLGPGGDSLDIPRQLPPIRTLLKQPLNNHYHANPTSLNLHVWYLGVQHSKNMVSLQKWQKELLLLRDSEQNPSTHRSGLFSNVSVQKNRWTSGIPL